LRAKLSLRWLRVGGLRLLFRQTSDRVRRGFNLHGASLTTKQIESAGRLNVRPALVPVYLPYSKSVGSLNRPESLMLPWPHRGQLGWVGSAGSRLDAVSSGGNKTSEFRNASKLFISAELRLAKASLCACASPPWRRMTALRVMLRPSCP